MRSVLGILVLILSGLEMGCQYTPPEFDGNIDDGRTTVVSVDSSGANLAYGGEFYPSISGDGLKVAFGYYNDNLVPYDENGKADVFVHDLTSGETTRVSVASDGSEGDGSSESPSISGNGRFVAFSSRSTNLTADATNPFYTYGIYVHDLQTGITELVSKNSEGNRADLGGESPSVSDDGRFVAFASYSADLVLNDTNETADVFLHDRETRETALVSIGSEGLHGNNKSDYPKITADGRYVAFWSFATNLVPNDTNEASDIFVYDRLTKITTRVNVNSDGSQSEGGVSHETALSANGRIIAFISSDEKLDGRLRDINSAVFIHDRDADANGVFDEQCTGCRTTIRVDAEFNDPLAKTGEAATHSLAISGDGRFVAFHRGYTLNLPPPFLWDRHDANLFIQDRQTGITKRVAVDSPGFRIEICFDLFRMGLCAETDETMHPSLSYDGRFIAFEGWLSKSYIGYNWQAFVEDLGTVFD